MKLSEVLCIALCQEAATELYNMLCYEKAYSYFEDIQLKNLGKHFKSQANEEKEHYDKFVQYINARVGGKASLPEIDQPTFEIRSLQDVADLYMKIEQDTTAAIEELYGLALETKSYVDLPFLSEMLCFQVVEEDEAQEFFGKVAIAKDLILFDSTFGG